MYNVSCIMPHGQVGSPSKVNAFIFGTSVLHDPSVASDTFELLIWLCTIVIERRCYCCQSIVWTDDLWTFTFAHPCGSGNCAVCEQNNNRGLHNWIGQLIWITSLCDARVGCRAKIESEIDARLDNRRVDHRVFSMVSLCFGWMAYGYYLVVKL